jgi:hypothetical protein
MRETNFQQQLEFRNRLLHLKAVYKELTDHLGKFVDTDAVPAKMGIRSEGDGLVVPQKIIIDVQEFLQKKIAEAEVLVHNLNVSKVINVEGITEQAEPEKASSPKASAGPARKAPRRKSSN